MQIVKINVYSVDELSEKAREKAFHNWMESTLYPWDVDNEKTLDAFCEVFGVKIIEWSYSTCDYYYRFTLENESHENLRFIRILSVINNHFHEFVKGKYYSTRGDWINGKFVYKYRYSRVLYDKNYSLTGYYMDDEILKPIFDFMRKPRQISYKELIDECLRSFFEACRDDVDRYFSMQNFIFEANQNGWLYFEDGSLFKY